MSDIYNFESQSGKNYAIAAAACIAIATVSFVCSKLQENEDVRWVSDKVAKVFAVVSVLFIGASAGYEICELKRQIILLGGSRADLSNEIPKCEGPAERVELAQFEDPDRNTIKVLISVYV
ncbi:hypothetical protein K0U07_04990 [bacterium]|nr:hypothetical protein [bacterium]